MWQRRAGAVVLFAFCLCNPFSNGFLARNRHSLPSLRSTVGTQLHLFGRRTKDKESTGPTEGQEDAIKPAITVTNTQPEHFVQYGRNFRRGPFKQADIVIVGGGVSGLAASITAAKSTKGKKIVLLEANSKLGGRVQSVATDDGFVLDEGFAVFIDQYPEVRKLVDFDALKLKPFLPGALVKLKNRNGLARVADPLRNPKDTIPSVLAPVGTLLDKIEVLPLILNVRSKSVEELFEEREADTMTALTDRWGFSDDFISKFLKPFLEGIYLAPLDQQSSRMFSFVFKMFSEGSATLPAGGMKAVSDQLVAKAESLGVEILTESPVTGIVEEDGGSFIVECAKDRHRYETSTLVVATDGVIAQKLISNIQGFESLEDLPEQPQLSVGCLYYSFKGDPPVDDPILILNGMGAESGNEKNPVNNVCFPSVVNEGYAPAGYSLCSVTVLGEAMKLYVDRPQDLDKAVRSQLATWFQDQADDINNKWELKKIFYIPKAQPSQYKGPFPASVNGGRPSNQYRGKDLPRGLFVCGDHMATATLNGAVESGVAAGIAAASAANAPKKRTEKVSA
ncbi:oxidoreductase, FAD-binding [Nitzschia inconspicua]|uniref:Oxidoreductase, FAD-binding n=1 Tax=Nitzschia inconspicua TaxID=303405 RepID=A0A9K3PWX4_9STRA|nr:oxidoreductase, FAD-binding [Nitzschia inconspicua]